MSDKPYAMLNPVDRMIREAQGFGNASDGVILTIERIVGFELFNTRPYHNYETWSDGWRITGGGIAAQAEDLDDAAKRWVEAYAKKKENRSGMNRCR